MTLQEATQNLRKQLTTIYDDREAANIADWVIEHVTGWKKAERLLLKQAELPDERTRLLDDHTRELLDHKPVQYVLGEAWFCGMRFNVNENVLIPRPETEELVEWIVSENNSGTVLDIGTGSGCIAISIKKKKPSLNVFACDVSAAALKVAQSNNHSVNMVQADILDKHSRKNLTPANILVSNPPYIPLKDKHTMHANVLQYEPHIALFVEDDDPLIFYNAIAHFANEGGLLPGGAIYVEIHEDLGKHVQELFHSHGFTHTELKKDMQGKDRMIRAKKA